MKTKALLAMGLGAAIGLLGLSATTAFAAEEGHEHAEHESKVKIPDTVEGIFKAIHEEHMELAEAVENKELEEVHHHAFAIRDLSKPLPAKAAANQKKRVEATVRNIARLAAALDESGDSGDQAKTEANLKRLDGALKELHAQFGMKMESNEHAMQYTCPMHPGVVQAGPGKCPKCGMKLVARNEAHAH